MFSFHSPILFLTHPPGLLIGDILGEWRATISLTLAFVFPFWLAICCHMTILTHIFHVFRSSYVFSLTKGLRSKRWKTTLYISAILRLFRSFHFDFNIVYSCSIFILWFGFRILASQSLIPSAWLLRINWKWDIISGNQMVRESKSKHSNDEHLYASKTRQSLSKNYAQFDYSDRLWVLCIMISGFPGSPAMLRINHVGNTFELHGNKNVELFPVRFRTFQCIHNR